MDAARFKFSQRTARLFENHDADFDVSLNNENKNTKRKTETDMRIFSSYLVSINEIREPETIPAEQLDRHLATYFSVIKKHDGNEYEPASLRGMLCSIERYLRSKGYPISLTRDAEFASTRNMLKERQKLLRDLAKTDKVSKSDNIALSTVHRLNQLYLAKEFGPHNPSAVINALCFAFVVHLKIRKAIDHKQLLWGDIVLKVSPNNDEYLCYEPLPGYEYCRLPLKGISGYRVLAQSQETSLWDPVSIYKLYRLRRPGSMLAPDSPFYLGVTALAIHDSEQQLWYKPVAMGVNKLNDLVRMIRDITGTLVHGPSYSFDTYETSNVGENIDSRVLKFDSVHSGHRAGSSTGSDVITPDDASDENAADTRESENDGDDGFDEKRYADDQYLTLKSTGDRNEAIEDIESAVEEAKTKVKTLLDSLKSDVRSDVIRWLKTSLTGTDSKDNQQMLKQSRKRIRLSIDLDEEDLANKGSVDKKIRLQIIQGSGDTSGKNPVQNSDTGNHIPVESFDDTNVSSKTSTKEVADISFYNQVDNLHKMRQYVFKRALSCPNDLKDTTTPRTHRNDRLDNPVSPSERLETPNQVLGDSETDKEDKMSPVSEAEGREFVPGQGPPIQGYNPYAAWALDPRFAMFMRTGFIQTYQDFLNMYNNQEAKNN